mgnify:CR=1 FL=1
MADNSYELKHLPFSARNPHEADPIRSARQVLNTAAGSPAEACGIRAGDELLEVNGRRIKDVFDYRLAVLDDHLTMRLKRPDGTLYTVEIEKAEDEDPGLEFAESMMDDPLHCHNQCLFCFIDQLPPGMRETLYFKDDDMRLSFLSGNYITLTNMKDEELDRLIAYKLSPMNVSVHTTNPELRKKMLGNRFAGRIREQLRRIAAAGIKINVQIVLMPGLNDGEELDRTLEDLAALGDALQSVACVPVGLTRYREALGLPYIRPCDQAAARALLRQSESWQKRFRKQLGRRVFFPSDEFFLLAGEAIPEADYYEGFPQLENGIGLLALFRQECRALIRKMHRGRRDLAAYYAFKNKKDVTFHMPVGTAAYAFMQPLCRQLARCFGTELILHPVENRFFGERITVTGLLTGQDVSRALLRAIPEERRGKEAVLIGDVMLRQGDDIFLDDWTLDDLEATLKLPVLKSGQGAKDIAAAILKGKDLLL